MLLKKKEMTHFCCIFAQNNYMSMYMKRIFLSIMAAMACIGMSAQQLPYQNPSLSAKERAIDLCSRLTLEEKAMLMQDESPAIPRLGIKKFFWWSEALHGAANMGNVTVFPESVGMDPQCEHLPRPAVGPWTGDVWRRPLSDVGHGHAGGARTART